MLLKYEVRPDFYTFPLVLKACGNLFDGKKIHCWVFKLGFEWDVFVAASLVHMYCHFGYLAVAHKIFSDMPFRNGGWNAMISGFCQNGNALEALGVLDEMRFEGMKMDCVTGSTILPACAQMDDILHGMLIHLYVIKHGLEFDVFVSNALINIDLVSWNSIIAAYEQNAHPDTALKFFGEMQSNGIQPDVLTIVSLASSVAQSRDCRSGRSGHGFMMRRCWILEDVAGNAVVDVYAKLGIIDSACRVFEEIPLKDVVSWNTMITGYGQNGLASEAIEVFCTMEACKDVTPNQGTWVSILPAYSHLGALKLGIRTHGHILKANLHLDVYVGTCLIDLYGKCGRLDDAMSLFYEVPRMSSVLWNAIISCQGFMDTGVKPDHVTFVSLLSARSHSGLVGQGQWCFRWERADEVRSLARDRGLKKTPGWSPIELNNRIEVFYTGNQSHPYCEEIYKELEILAAKIKNIGYIPDYSFVLQDVEEDEKEYILTRHMANNQMWRQQCAQLTTQMVPKAPLPFSLTDRDIQGIVDAYKEHGNPKYAFQVWYSVSQLLVSITIEVTKLIKRDI
ncbi:hypothetical protein HYC85_000272 [Camellia sinensis]|uniref:DYW domain-containing protein n=1 Tax=Camellia sinensis TaxID=4442 RepID=A0A7J7I1Y1_CAMSI|nr:hypothetical protein HYC85_000272 [Camellia sinensis]